MTAIWTFRPVSQLTTLVGFALLAGCGQAPTTQDCDAISASWQATYDQAISDNKSCSDTSDCHAPSGECGTGLSWCQEMVNTQLTAADLNLIGDGYQREMDDAGCTVYPNICDCYGDETAQCTSGVCESG